MNLYNKIVFFSYLVLIFSSNIRYMTDPLSQFIDISL